MKNRIAFTGLLLLFFMPFWLAAQAPDISGTWKGAIELPTMKLEIIVDFFQKDGGWKGEIDIPLQQSKDLELTEVTLEGEVLTFLLPAAPGNANFKGKVNAAVDEISGDFNQGGQTFPLKIVLGSKVEFAAEQERKKKALADFKVLADSLIIKRNVPGAAVCIVHKGEVIFSEGFGLSDLDEDRKVNAKTMFAIGSSSKAFTTLAMSILADEGLLDWEKPVREYLPDFRMHDPFATEHMTAMDLVTHRSGLPRHDLVWYGSDASREELYKRIQYLPLNKSFRSAWQYQNLMYMTAGLLAGKLAGTSWEKLVEERIFAPLGMKNSTTSVVEMQKMDNRALPYIFDEEKDIFERMPYRNIDAIGPAGSINSNVEEMANWLKLQLNHGEFGEEQIVSRTAMAQMHSPQMVMGIPAGGPDFSAPNYGMGWMLYQYKGLKAIEHGGNIDGFSAGVWMLPAEQFGIVVLTNMNGTRLPTMLSLYAADMVLDLEETDWDTRMNSATDYAKKNKDKDGIEDEPVKGTKPSHELADYVGTYFNSGYGNLEIKLDDKNLKGKVNGLEFNLNHWHYDVFNGRIEILNADIRLNFSTNMKGDIDKASGPLEPTLDDIEFMKLPPAQLSDPDFLAKLVGSYKLQGQRIKIVLTGETQLQLILPNATPIDLIPDRKYEFKGNDLNGFSIEFVIDKKGECNELLAKQPGKIMSAKRATE